MGPKLALGLGNTQRIATDFDRFVASPDSAAAKAAAERKFPVLKPARSCPSGLRITLEYSQMPAAQRYRAAGVAA